MFREFAEGLRHQPGLQTHVNVAHVAFELRTGNQRRYRVDDHNVEGSGANQHVHDLQCLLAGIGLRDQQLVHVDTQRFGVPGIERVLRVDEGGNTAISLCLGHDVERQGGFTAGFGTVDLDHPAARNPSDTKGEVDGQRTGRDGGVLLCGGGAELHDRAFAELALDLSHCHVELFVSLHLRLLWRFSGYVL